MFRSTFLLLIGILAILSAFVAEGTEISSLSPETIENTLKNMNPIGDVILTVANLKKTEVSNSLLNLRRRADMSLKLRLTILDLSKLKLLCLKKRKIFLQNLASSFRLQTGRRLETIIVPQTANHKMLRVLLKLRDDFAQTFGRRIDIIKATIEESEPEPEPESEADEPGPSFDAFSFVSD